MSRPLNYDGNLKPYAQELRRNMTRQERHLWYDYLKTCPIPFHRQKQFGSYIVDFYCAKCNLVVEIDGSQHYEREGKIYDESRTTYLNFIGLKVMRFSNYDIDRHFEAVCETIDSIIQECLEG